MENEEEPWFFEDEEWKSTHFFEHCPRQRVSCDPCTSKPRPRRPCPGCSPPELKELREEDALNEVRIGLQVLEEGELLKNMRIPQEFNSTANYGHKGQQQKTEPARGKRKREKKMFWEKHAAHMRLEQLVTLQTLQPQCLLCTFPSSQNLGHRK